MACGLGVCWTCVVPVIRRDGRGWDNQRSCREGPVFNGARVHWDQWLGAPAEREPATPPDGHRARAGRPPGGYPTIPPVPVRGEG